MPLTLNTDMVREASEKLRKQFQDKPVIGGLVNSWVSELQILAGVFDDICGHVDINQAAGASLDVWGLLLVEPRSGRNDSDYRNVLLTKVLVNNSSGLASELLAIVRQVLDPADPIILEEYYPSYGKIEVLGVTDPVDAALVGRFLQKAKQAGVHINLHFGQALPAFTIGNIGDPDLDGFSTIASPTSGGAFTELA